MALVGQRSIPIDKFKSYFEQAKTFNFRGSYSSHSQTQNIRNARWNNCGSRFACIQGERIIRVQQNSKPDSKSGSEIRQGHAGVIDDISWIPLNSDVLASCGIDGIKIWDVRTKTALNSVSLKTEHTQGHAIQCQYSHDGLSIAVGTRDRWLLVLDAESLQLKASFKEKSLIDFDWSNDSQYIAVALENGDVNLVNIKDSTMSSVLILRGPQATASCVRFDPRGEVLAVGTRDGIVSLWSLDSWVCVRTLNKVDAPVKSISFSHDGEYLAIGYEMQTPVDIVSTSTGEYVYQIPKSISFSPFAAVSWHPLRYQLIYTAEDGAVNILNRL